jgi:hypothetical protein
MGEGALDYRDNMLPINQASDSYTGAGITITHDGKGVFTLNGTSTSGVSFEIIPNKTPYATLVKGVQYKIGIKGLGGENLGGNINLIIGAEEVGNVKTITYSTAYTCFVYDAPDNYTLNRFALNVGKAGITYKDFKIAPYFGVEFPEDYAGAEQISEEAMEIRELRADIETLFDAQSLIPDYYIAERKRAIAESQGIQTDFRMIAFADPHSFDWAKYKKYNDLVSSGCVDALVGLGDYQPYASPLTRVQTIQNLTDSATNAGRTPNCYYAVGNHDIGFKSTNSGAVSQDNVLTKKELHDSVISFYRWTMRLLFAVLTSAAEPILILTVNSRQNVSVHSRHSL